MWPSSAAEWSGESRRRSSGTARASAAGGELPARRRLNRRASDERHNCIGQRQQQESSRDGGAGTRLRRGPQHPQPYTSRASGDSEFGAPQRGRTGSSCPVTSSPTAGSAGAGGKLSSNPRAGNAGYRPGAGRPDHADAVATSRWQRGRRRANRVAARCAMVEADGHTRRSARPPASKRAVEDYDSWRWFAQRGEESSAQGHRLRALHGTGELGRACPLHDASGP